MVVAAVWIKRERKRSCGAVLIWTGTSKSTPRCWRFLILASAGLVSRTPSWRELQSLLWPNSWLEVCFYLRTPFRFSVSYRT
jgi:hypothetical protein